MTPQEFRNYLAAGIVCQSLWPGVEGTSAVQMYSYNGLSLPALPEHDSKAYPYAYITPGSVDSEGSVRVVFSASRFMAYDNPAEDVDVYPVLYGTNGVDCAILRYEYDAKTLSWGEAVYSEDWSPSWRKFYWCNTSIYYGDEVYYSASDPVPVYT